MEKNVLKESLKIKITELEPCLKKADISIFPEAVDSEMNLVVKEFIKHAKLPGFRAGYHERIA